MLSGAVTLPGGRLTSLLTAASPVSGLGMSQKVGHLDFFPNGGEQMPGCQKNILSSIVDINGIWEGVCISKASRQRRAGGKAGCAAGPR